MGLRRTRSRMLDLAVVLLCTAFVAAPFVGSAPAVERSILESSADIDQRVVQSALISNPEDATFGKGRSGVVDGAIAWDVYTTSDRGMKLVVAADRDPAMRDAQNGVDVEDYGTDPSAWSVGAKDRRFGFSVMGDISLARYDKGAKWRGFAGTKSIEIGRRLAPIGTERTTLRLRAEFGSSLDADARPTAGIVATGVVNL